MTVNRFFASVLDYGADPTGVLNSTAAIQRACDENSSIFFPAGTYLLDTVTVTGSTTLCGAGDGATVLKTTNLTDNVLTFRDHGWHIRDMKFDAAEDRIGGAYIYAAWKENREFTASRRPGAANFASLSDLAFTRQYIGIELDGCWSVNIANITAFDGTSHETAAGGCIIRLGRTTYTGPIHIRGLTARTCGPERQPTAGIHMGHVDVVAISDALLIYHRSNLLITPGKNQFAALIEVCNSCLDTAYHGMTVAPTAGGRVLRCGFTNTWFGAHKEDAVVIDGTDGTVTGLQFSNCMFLCNAENGISVAGSGVDGLYFSNSFISGNLGCGLLASRGARDIVWNGGVIGVSHELPNGNVGYGCKAESGSRVRFALARLTGNQAGAILESGGKVQLFACETEEFKED